MSKTVVFDLPRQAEIRDARIAFLRRVLPPWQKQFGLCTGLDLGCGVGDFAAALRDLGLETTATDARDENIIEARSRHSGIDFHVADAEDSRHGSRATYDFVLCFGLLYHLENPLRAFRNLRVLTGKLLLLESMCLPDAAPFLYLLDEPRGGDQSMRAISCYPSEGAMIKMAYRAGFAHVYRFRELPDHEDFRGGIGKARPRTVLAISNVPLESDLLTRAEEPASKGDLWTTDPTGITKTFRRLGRSLRKSRTEKRR